jgi:hypothetical protein
MHLILDSQIYSEMCELDMLIENVDNLDEKSISEKIKTMFKRFTSKEQVVEFLKKYVPVISKFSEKVARGLISLVITLSLGFITSSEVSSINYGSKTSNELVMNSMLDLGISSRESERTINFPVIDDQTKEFLDTLSFKESSNNWKAAKRSEHISKNFDEPDTIYHDYIGQYQLGKTAFLDIGKEPVDYDKFIKNPYIYPKYEQDKDILKLLKRNKTYLKHFMGYVGKTINGIKITESGLLASAHLVGQQKVKKFILSNGEEDPVDGNKVPCSHYLKYFGGFKVNI